MSEFIPLSVPNITGNENKYVSEAVSTAWVSTGGGFVDDFEKNIAHYVGVPKAVACQSGTAGLHLALVLGGVEASDEVIVPTLTFIAAVNPVRYQGANPIFMDCGEDLLLDLDKLEAFLKTCDLREDGLYNPKSQARIKALIVVHVFGNVGDMARLVELCKTYKLFLIEDATEALGSYIIENGQKRFAGTFGQVGVYSFNGNKIITTGGGGMMVSKDEALMERAKYLSTQAKDNPVDYVHGAVGYNYRMTNVQAALGVAQLERLEEFIKVKETNYKRYKNGLKVKGLSLLPFHEGRPNRWFYSLILDDTFPMTRQELFTYLNDHKVQTRPIWGLIHEQKPFEGFETYEIDRARDWQKRILNLPCSTNLTSQEVDRVLELLNKAGQDSK